MRIINRVNKLLLLIITLFLVLNINTVVRAEQSSQPGVTVFIIDTGIEEKHLNDDRAKINENTEHGSLVAWIIRRDVKDADIRIIPIEVADAAGNIQHSLYLAGLQKIIDYRITHPGQRILVNISLGFSDKIGYKYTAELYDRDVQIIAAAGNNNSRQPVYPAGFTREVIAVANAVHEGKAESSNYGLYVDIAAPGSLEYIESIYFPGQRLNRKFKFAGTSFSAPRVTALLALLLSKESELTVRQAVDIIKETSQPIKDDLYEEGLLGAGIINRDGALARVVENYRLQQYIKIIAFFTVIGVILFLLWQIYKIFSIFILILLGIVLFPLLVVIGENIENWLLRGQKYLPLVLIILISLYIINKIVILAVGKINKPAGIVKLLSLPSAVLRKHAQERLIQITAREDVQLLLEELSSTDNKSKKKILIEVITAINNPPLKSLLHYCCQSRDIVDFAAAKIAAVNNKEMLLQLLFNYLRKNDYKYREIVVKILKKIDVDLVLEDLLTLLKSDFKINKGVVLEIIEFYGIDAAAARMDVKKILEESSNMWLRYQAVKTLYNISVDKESILSYLKGYVNDEQELVALEVKGLLKDFENSK